MKRFPADQSRDVQWRTAAADGLWKGARVLAALLSAAILLLLSLASTAAHPFPLDTSTLSGFEVLTAEDGATKSQELVVLKYDGPIVFPMAENLQVIWAEVKKNGRFKTMLLRLNSEGGTDLEGRAVIQLLAAIRSQIELVTLVGDGDLCASMCVPVYIQGNIRLASPASSWMFHGASRFMSNIPNLAATDAYFDLFRTRNIDADFIGFLFDNQYVTKPGAYWMSGGDLAAKSNVITRLLPNWRPAEPRPGPWSGIQSGV